ncbi:MFS transporter [Metasolibacillus meyeri]|uniref:MFS transporter n=1 Tax=Metasolibacillus meyeri TaxID=1071052 RepID=A0AAW9NM70_9BACL|nr:MFS transporter [Metasolibacillus meyeri]MEC1177065.1 MFS transporter [Metasolibacillus meyeri]
MKWKEILIIMAIFIVSLNLRPAITSIGPLLNTIRADLHISGTQVSLLTAIPVFCMGLFAPLAVPMQRRFDLRSAIFMLIALIGVATFMRMFAASYSMLLATSLLVGFAIAIISPMLNTFIKMHFPHKVATVVSIYSLAMGAGATLSAGFTAVFYEYFGKWTTALGVWSVLAVIALIVWRFAIKPDEGATLFTAISSEVRNPWKTKKAWILLLFFGMQASLFFSLMTWLAPVAMEHGFSVITAGTILTAMSLVQLTTNALLPSFLAKYPNHIAWLFILLAVGSIGASCLFIGTSSAIWAGAMLLGVTLGGLFPLALTLPLNEARNREEANAWSSMVMSGGFMMSAMIPLFIGFVYDMMQSHFYTKIIFALLLLALFLAVFAISRAGEKK